MLQKKVDLYDNAYGNYESDTYRQVRIETYGEDFGQTSWVTTEESKEIPKLLDLRLNSSVLGDWVRFGGIWAAPCGNSGMPPRRAGY